MYCREYHEPNILSEPIVSQNEAMKSQIQGPINIQSAIISVTKVKTYLD